MREQWSFRTCDERIPLNRRSDEPKTKGCEQKQIFFVCQRPEGYGSLCGDRVVLEIKDSETGVLSDEE